MKQATDILYVLQQALRRRKAACSVFATENGAKFKCVLTTEVPASATGEQHLKTFESEDASLDTAILLTLAQLRQWETGKR